MERFLGGLGNSAGNFISGGSTEQHGPFTDDHERVREHRDASRRPRKILSALELTHGEITGRYQRRLKTVANLEEERKQLESINATWIDAIKETKQQRNTLNQDLDVSRITLHEVLALFTTVNDMIEAATVEQMGLKCHFPQIYLFIRSIQRGHQNDIKADVIIGPMVRHILCVRLMQNIFTPFFPNMKQSLGNFFTQMRQGIEERDGLDCANLWRSITTAQLNDPLNDFAKRITKLLIEDIKTIYHAPHLVEALTPDIDLAESILSLVQTAVHAQQKAKVRCIEGEVKIYTVDHGQTYDDTVMKPVEVHPQPRYYPSCCLLTVGIGMEADRVVKEPDGSINFQKLIYKPADTLCMNWLHVK